MIYLWKNSRSKIGHGGRSQNAIFWEVPSKVNFYLNKVYFLQGCIFAWIIACLFSFFFFFFPKKIGHKFLVQFWLGYIWTVFCSILTCLNLTFFCSLGWIFITFISLNYMCSSNVKLFVMVFCLQGRTNFIIFIFIFMMDITKV